MNKYEYLGTLVDEIGNDVFNDIVTTTYDSFVFKLIIYLSLVYLFVKIYDYKQEGGKYFFIVGIAILYLTPVPTSNLPFGYHLSDGIGGMLASIFRESTALLRKKKGGEELYNSGFLYRTIMKASSDNSFDNVLINRVTNIRFKCTPNNLDEEENKNIKNEFAYSVIRYFLLSSSGIKNSIFDYDKHKNLLKNRNFVDFNGSEQNCYKYIEETSRQITSNFEYSFKNYKDIDPLSLYGTEFELKRYKDDLIVKSNVTPREWKESLKTVYFQNMFDLAITQKGKTIKDGISSDDYIDQIHNIAGLESQSFINISTWKYYLQRLGNNIKEGMNLEGSGDRMDVAKKLLERRKDLPMYSSLIRSFLKFVFVLFILAALVLKSSTPIYLWSGLYILNVLAVPLFDMVFTYYDFQIYKISIFKGNHHLFEELKYNASYSDIDSALGEVYRLANNSINVAMGLVSLLSLGILGFANFLNKRESNMSTALLQRGGSEAGKFGMGAIKENTKLGEVMGGMRNVAEKGIGAGGAKAFEGVKMAGNSAINGTRGAMEGAKTGVSIGGAIGSLGGPIGAGVGKVVGGAVGAVGGGVSGAASGLGKMANIKELAQKGIEFVKGTYGEGVESEREKKEGTFGKL